MRLMRFLSFLAIVVASLLPNIGLCQTKDFLNAPRVKNQVQLRIEGKKIRYALDGSDKFEDLDPNKLLLASSPIKVTYPKLNPLEIQMTAAVTETDDPGNAAITKLVEALLGFPALIKPTTAGAAREAALSSAPNVASCAELENALNHVDILDQALYSADVTPKVLSDEIAKWKKAINDNLRGQNASGPDAVQAGIDAINAYKAKLATVLKNAESAIKDIEAGATVNPANECSARAKLVYQALQLTSPRRRLQEIKSLSDTVDKLAKTLASDFQPPEKWFRNTNFIVQDVVPKSDKMQTIAVKAIQTKLQVSDVDGSLSLDKQDLASASFTLREFSRFAPEVGVGLVAAFIDLPRFGTSTNSAGQTTVAKIKTDNVSVDPSLMVNFVCRCGAGPYFEPMWQIGVAASKDTPAIFTGLGLRLFSVAKGDVAVGGGAAFAWVKDLQKLSVGDVVTGTKDIEQDLSFDHAPRVRPYFTIQYKF